MLYLKNNPKILQNLNPLNVLRKPGPPAWLPPFCPEFYEASLKRKEIVLRYLSFSDKQRLLRGVLDGPMVVGHSRTNYGPENEYLLGEILKHTTIGST